MSVAILGAGPAGLTLARLLEINDIDYIVYERDASAETSRNRGGCLDLHPASGQAALKAAGLFDQFQKLARYDAQEMRVMALDGEVIFHRKYEGQEEEPEIDRSDLRDILVTSIPNDRIKWNMVVKDILKQKDGSVNIPFTNGHEAKGFKLVVAADGIWTKARKLVTSAVPKYSGVHYLQAPITHSNPAFEKLSQMLGPGAIVSIGSGRQFSAQRMRDGTINVYIGLNVPEHWAKNSKEVQNADTFRGKLLEQDFKAWSTELTDFVKYCEGSFFSWPLYATPVSALDWQTVPGIALVGDAAHVSTPFVGEGVNVAMHDSLQLAEEIFKHGLKNLDEAVAAYEKKMFPRAIDLINRSNASKALMHAEDAPKGFKQVIQGTSPGEEKLAMSERAMEAADKA